MHKELKCGAENATVGPERERADDAWEHSCDVDIQKGEAKDAKSVFRSRKLAWAVM